MLGAAADSPRFATDQSGAAAVELALTLPFLLLLFFGAVNIADYISKQNRLAAATALVSGLVARNDAVVSRRDIDDYFAAAGLSLGSSARDTVRIEVRAFRKSGGVLNPEPRWSRGWGGGQCTAPDLTSLPDIIEDERDVILTVSCMTYAPLVASILGGGLPGFASATLRQEMAAVPRESTTLSCNDC